MYWHISPLEITEGPLASFPGTEQFSGLQISWRRWHGKGKIHLQISGLSSVHNNVCTLPSHSFVKFQMCDHMFCWIYRGGGFISLENLLYFSKNFPVSKKSLLLLHLYRDEILQSWCSLGFYPERPFRLIVWLNRIVGGCQHSYILTNLEDFSEPNWLACFLRNALKLARAS